MDNDEICNSNHSAEKMRYLIIGLGIYGSNLARDLADMGHEIIGADNRKANVEAIKDYISTTYLIDATEESSLALLPLNNVDLVIVAIGENFGASIKVVAILKKMNVKHIYARAIDTLHESILQGFDIDRIITPEQQAARDLTNELALGTRVYTMTVDDSHFVMKFRVPRHFVGLHYSDIDMEKNYQMKLIAVTRDRKETNILGIKQDTPEIIDYSNPETISEEGDILTCFGSRDSYKSLIKEISRNAI